MILPRVKNLEESSGWFCKTLIFPKSEDGEKAAGLLKVFSPGLKAECGSDPNVSFKKADMERKGEYTLSVTEEGICIEYHEYEGLRNALATLSGLEKEGKIGCAKISDYPDQAFRSCLLDMARGYVEIDVLKEHLVRLAKLKFNFVHLHLMDRLSYILESDIVPNPDNHRLYTKKEMRDVVEFCNLLGLDAIPEIEFPAHAGNLLKALPELGCDIIDMDKAVQYVEGIENYEKSTFIDQERKVSRWTVCVGKESTYEIYEKIIDELLEIFDSEYIHIGGDEIMFPRLGALPHWDNCHACQKLAEKYDSNILAMYHHGIRRIHEIVKSKGKKTIKWNESRECNHDVDLPGDIILEYWLSSESKKSQQNIDRFLDLGYTLINAEHTYTYVDLHVYMNAEKINAWKPALNEKQEKGICGGEMCAWELGNKAYSYYNYTLPICMVLFSDRVWNSDGGVEYDDEYKKSIFTTLLGENALKVSPLSIFKDLIPPRKRIVTEEIDLAAIDPEKILEIQAGLDAVNPDLCYGKLALKNFQNYLNDLYGERIKLS